MATYALSILQLAKEGDNFADRLRDDLIINKGFWTWIDPKASQLTRSNKDPNFLPDIRGIKTKIAQLLEKMGEFAYRSLDRLHFSIKNIGLEHANNPGNPTHPDKYWSDPASSERERNLGWLVGALRNQVDEMEVPFDSLTRTLTAWLKLWDMHGSPDPEHDSFHNQSYAPHEIALGRAKLIVGSVSLEPREGGGMREFSHPMHIDWVIGGCKIAMGMLAKHGLSKLWYGLIYVRPPGDGKFVSFANRPGFENSRADATYSVTGDYLTLYVTPSSHTVDTLLHELGHRYYYKFMTAKDRQEFDDYFGKVPAVSAYGASNTAEDWAELFANVLLGRGIPGDVRDRLLKFMIRNKHWREEKTPAELAATILEGVTDVFT